MENTKSIVDLSHIFDNSQFSLKETDASNKILVVNEKDNIFVVKDKNNEQEYYQVKKEKEFKSNTKYSFLNQCERSFGLIHPAVLNLSGFSIDKPCLYYLNNNYYYYYKFPKESSHFLKSDLPSENIQKILLGIASGLSYLLSKGFFYTDFSIWSSVVFDKNDSPKLFDYVNFDIANKNFEKDLITRYAKGVNDIINIKKKKSKIKVDPEFQKLLDRCNQTTDYPSLNDFIEFLSTKNFNLRTDVIKKKPFKIYLSNLQYVDKLISDGKFMPVNSIENISFYFCDKDFKDGFKTDGDDFYFLNTFPEYYFKKISNLLQPLSELKNFLFYEDLSLIFQDWKQFVQLYNDTNPFKIYKKLMKKIKELENNKNEEIHMFNKRREIEIQIDALRIQAIYFLKKTFQKSNDVQVKIELAVQYINGSILPYNFNKALDIINGIVGADKKTKKLVTQMKNKIETTIESASIQKILPKLAPKQKEILLKAEDEEDILSMLYCGFAFYSGFNGFPIMRILSIQFYRKAAKKSPQAMTLLGYLYLKGVIFPQNFHRAKNCFKKAADKGDIKAEIIDCLLRRHLWRTYLVDFDVDRIFGYYIPTFKSTVPNDGLVIPRMVYLTEKNCNVLYMAKLTKENEKLHSERTYENTSMFLELSDSLARSEILSPLKPFYSKKILLSSENFENTNNVNKQMSIAKSYFYGDNGFPIDYKEAAKYFKLAADKGDSEAQWRYALMCINQFDINFEAKDIKKYFQKSILQNDLRGKLLYALYLKNCGDNTIFEQIAQECCDSGSTDAMYYYALHLENIDLDQSINYYKKAADQGHFYSLIRLIYIYKYKEMHNLYEHYLTLSVALMNEPLLARLISFYDRMDEYKESNILIQMGIKLNYRLFNAYYADHLLYGKGMKPNIERAEKFVILANKDDYKDEYKDEYMERYIYIRLEIYLRRKQDVRAADYLNKFENKLTERYRKKFLLFYRNFNQEIAEHNYINANFCSEDYRKCQNTLISLNKGEKINLPKVLGDLRIYAFKDHNPYAIAILGSMYKQGKYVIRDLKKAVQFFAISAKEGCPEGYYYLGKEYYYGRILNQDYGLAKENLNKALKNFGEPRAGYYLYKIPGIKNDEFIDDVECLKISAYFGYKRALYKYGHRLITGKDDRIPKNEKEGYEFIKRAASQNFKKAIIFCKLYSSRYSYDESNSSGFVDNSQTTQISLKNFDEDASYSDIENETEDKSPEYNLSFTKERSSPLRPISVAYVKNSPKKDDADKEEEKILEFINKVERKSSRKKDKKSSNKKIAKKDEKDSDSDDDDDDDDRKSTSHNKKDKKKSKTKKKEKNSELNNDEEEEISEMIAFWY